ncbi:MAG: hypothetical protein Q9210_004826 [Variospora velana]
MASHEQQRCVQRVMHMVYLRAVCWVLVGKRLSIYDRWNALIASLRQFDSTVARMTLGETKKEPDVTCRNKITGDEESSFEAKSLKSKESDDPFGDESEAEIKYKIMTWW